MYGDTYVSTSVSQYAAVSALCPVWRHPPSALSGAIVVPVRDSSNGLPDGGKEEMAARGMGERGL
jgi:hypothetical protein